MRSEHYRRLLVVKNQLVGEVSGDRECLPQFATAVGTRRSKPTDDEAHSPSDLYRRAPLCSVRRSCVLRSIQRAGV